MWTLPDVKPSSNDEVSVVGEVLPDFNLSSEVAGLQFHPNIFHISYHTLSSTPNPHTGKSIKSK